MLMPAAIDHSRSLHPTLIHRLAIRSLRDTKSFLSARCNRCLVNLFTRTVITSVAASIPPLYHFLHIRETNRATPPSFVSLNAQRLFSRVHYVTESIGFPCATITRSLMRVAVFRSCSCTNTRARGSKLHTDTF